MIVNKDFLELLRFFLVVKENGGYATVTRNGLWEKVAKESNLRSLESSVIKLVYVKYLGLLRQWLLRLSKSYNSEANLMASNIDPNAFLTELDIQLKTFISDVSGRKNGHEIGLDYLVKVEDVHGSSRNENDICFLSKLDCSKARNMCKDDMKILNSSLVYDMNSFSKTKCGTFRDMLNWVTLIAKDPINLAVGSFAEMSRRKFFGEVELWKQALSARATLFFESPGDENSEQNICLKKKMHPAMYDDHLHSSSKLERSRYSQRLLSAKTSQVSISSEPSASNTQNNGPDTTTVDVFKKKLSKTIKSKDSDFLVSMFGAHARKRVRVGSFFQAKVPKWTGITLESDSKWVMTQTWPPPTNGHESIPRGLIGKGRQELCNCLVPNSMECVRFHISQKRSKMKLELGSAFYCWNFDKMGEDAALCWDGKEEKKFEMIVRSNPPSLGISFWDQICQHFRKKSRKDLVSYYYNVFLFRRRGRQNRISPNDIGSDDDCESDFSLFID